jgi:hypothetical protein
MSARRRLTGWWLPREAIERGRHKGKVSVRREQFKLLQAGNAAMGII